jgi:hypothetical protein
MAAGKKIWIVEVQIEGDEWKYKKGDIILVPVYASGPTTAANRLHDKFCGSEYPPFIVTRVTPCDRFLFKPIIRTEVDIF